MRQLSLKLNTYIRSITIINNSAEKIIFHIILWSFAVLALLYVLFLGNMVRDIIARRSLETSARTLGSEVRDLELTYLSMSSNVDLPLSYSMGFEEIKPTFATRRPLGYSTVSKSSNTKIAQNDL